MTDIFIHGASLLAQTEKNPPAMQESWVQSLGQEDPLALNFVLATRREGPCVTADCQFRDLALLVVAVSTPHGLQVGFPATAGLMHTL